MEEGYVLGRVFEGMFVLEGWWGRKNLSWEGKFIGGLC